MNDNKEKMQAKVKIEDIADYFIKFGQEHGDPVTHLKLQKLCYFAEAYYQASNNIPLTGETFEAWTHGPVSRKLWDKFKQYGWLPITVEGLSLSLNAELQKYLDDIASIFFNYNAFQLEEMTHLDPAWLQARGGIPLESKCDKQISFDEAKKYYKQFIKK